jgi:hypothetical protein
MPTTLFSTSPGQEPFNIKVPALAETGTINATKNHTIILFMTHTSSEK